jgi:shikimate kinase
MNLYLIGYRGSGKSTVAPLVAERLGWRWLDSDAEIQSRERRAIAEIFIQEGEAFFRELETSSIRELSMQNQIVAALGGGALLSETNRQLLAASGRTVWLRADPDILLHRVSEDGTSELQRPRLTALAPLDEIRQMLAERNSVYAACSDYAVDTDELSPFQVAAQIADWWDTVD